MSTRRRRLRLDRERMRVVTAPSDVLNFTSDPVRPPEGVDYLLRLALDTSWERVAARYGMTRELLDHATRRRRHMALGDRQRETEGVRRTEPAYLPLDDRARSYDWATVRLRGDNALGEVVEALRRHPRWPRGRDLDPVWRDPHETARLVWGTVLNAALRADATVGRHGLARDEDVAALDREPWRAMLPADSEVWVPFPMTFTVEDTAAAPTQASAGESPPAATTREVDPPWVVVLRRQLEDIRRVTRELAGHVESIVAQEHPGQELYAHVARLRMLAALADGVNAARHRPAAMGDVIQKLDEALVACSARRLAAVPQGMIAHETRLQDSAARDLLRLVTGELFDEFYRRLINDRVARPALRAEADATILAAYRVVLLVPVTEPLAYAAIQDAVERTATGDAGRERIDGALAAMAAGLRMPAVSNTSASDEAHDDEGLLAAYRDAIGSMIASIITKLRGDRRESLQQVASLLGSVGTYVGNLPGPPSLMGALYNIRAEALTQRMLKGGPVTVEEVGRFDECLARCNRFTNDEWRLLRRVMMRGPNLTAQESQQSVSLLRRLPSRYQAGPAWTGILGAFAAVSTVSTLYSVVYPEGAPQDEHISQLSWWTRRAFPLAPVVQGGMTVYSAWIQHASIRATGDVRTALEDAAGAWGKRAAILGVAISIGQGVEAYRQGNQADTLNAGIAVATGVVALVAASPLVVGGAVLLGCVAPLLLSPFRSDIDRLGRTRLTVLFMDEIEALRGEAEPRGGAREPRTDHRGRPLTLLQKVERSTGDEAIRARLGDVLTAVMALASERAAVARAAVSEQLTTTIPVGPTPGLGIAVRAAAEVERRGRGPTVPELHPDSPCRLPREAMDARAAGAPQTIPLAVALRTLGWPPSFVSRVCDPEFVTGPMAATPQG